MTIPTVLPDEFELANLAEEHRQRVGDEGIERFNCPRLYSAAYMSNNDCLKIWIKTRSALFMTNARISGLQSPENRVTAGACTSLAVAGARDQQYAWTFLPIYPAHARVNVPGAQALLPW